MKIRDRATGEIIEINDNEAGSYGISTQGNAPANTGSLNISPQQAMMAQLLLPSNQASMVSNAYNIQRQTEQDAQKQQQDAQEAEGAKALKTNALEVAQELKNRGTGGITGFKSPGLLIPGTEVQGTLNKYKQLRSLLSLENIKYLKGTGQISNAEQQLLAEAATSLEQNLSNEDFAAELDKIITNLGGTENADQVPSKSKGNIIDKITGAVTNNVEGKDRNIILDLLLGNSLNLANDSARSLELKGAAGDQIYSRIDSNLNKANELIMQMDNTTSPEDRKKIELEVNKLLNENINVGKGIESSFSDTVNMPTALRSALVGTEVASTAELPFALKNILTKVGSRKVAENVGKDTIQTIAPSGGTDTVSKGVNIIEKLRSITPKSYLGKKQAQAAAESTTQLSSKPFVDAGEKLVGKNPKVAKVLEEFKPALENIKTVPQLLDHMSEWGDIAYKTSGGTKSAAQARLFNEFYKTGLDILKTEAPEVYKYRRLLRYSHELPKNTSKALWRLLVGRTALKGFS